MPPSSSPNRRRTLIGFVTIDASGYLDQLVVSPDHWGSKLATALVDEAKRLSPAGVTLKVNADNTRAIRFYERNGFVHAGEDVNPASKRLVAENGLESVIPVTGRRNRRCFNPRDDVARSGCTAQRRRHDDAVRICQARGDLPGDGRCRIFSRNLSGPALHVRRRLLSSDVERSRRSSGADAIGRRMRRATTAPGKTGRGRTCRRCRRNAPRTIASRGRLQQRQMPRNSTPIISTT